MTQVGRNHRCGYGFWSHIINILLRLPTVPFDIRTQWGAILFNILFSCAILTFVSTSPTNLVLFWARRFLTSLCLGPLLRPLTLHIKIFVVFESWPTQPEYLHRELEWYLLLTSSTWNVFCTISFVTDWTGTIALGEMFFLHNCPSLSLRQSRYCQGCIFSGLLIDLHMSGVLFLAFSLLTLEHIFGSSFSPPGSSLSLRSPF